MKKLLISGSNDSQTISGKSITNLHIEVVYKYTTLDQGTNTNVNLSALNIQTEINQAGKSLTFQTFALPAHLRYLSKTHITSGLTLATSPLATTQYLGQLIDDDGTNTTRSIIVPIYTDDLNLSKGESIKINVQQLSSLIGTAVDVSSIYICYEEATDVRQPFLRIPKFIPLNSSVSEVVKSINYADDIHLVALSSLYSSDFIATSFNMNSKYMNIQNDVNDLIKHKNTKVVTDSFVIPLVDLKGNSYLKNTEIKLNVNTEKVTSNVDFIVYDEIIPMREVFYRFSDKLQKYSDSKKDDLLELSTDCAC